MIAEQPIGIFDSGIGGLTVANAIRKVLPKEKIIYFGDTGHMPYGDKSPDAIRYYSLKIGKFLEEKGCKVIVIACNTASSLAYDDLVQFMGDRIPILNVIDPVVHYVTDDMQYQKIGVIGTKATISSDVYARKLKERNLGLQVNSLATPLLAPMIEEGFFENNISHTVIESYLSSPQLQNIDALILACTHYPLIKREIESFFNNQVDILNTASIVADDVKLQLEKLQLLNNQSLDYKDEFYVSFKTPSFECSTKIFFGDQIELIQKNIWVK
ncbi:glutamate racemase [Pseudopedobacter saltans DSM 12145]|uniref:Glutamate racemase n=1 Tax=Pseudopedobacter saltans (strain ATCC 51119 / DSM 12145 / JCM 21818 / CCUG 39354 / LMG 10337 / NBRC 100064 / NCIMB 13643) TaxID=762903 RepID=F0S9F3_PSESL|nr:glutamate racemase [Pseudopedobacter saltans]ADY52503.1 glutamate racemase [Pseudopedobacter saltans DSM 12145]